MEESEFQALKTKILGLIEKWFALLQLQGWRVTCEYYHDHIPDSHNSSDALVVPATSTSWWQYKTILIRWNMNQLTKETENSLDEMVCHELLHGVVSELQEWRDDPPNGIKHEERVVTELSHIILALARTTKEEPNENPPS